MTGRAPVHIGFPEAIGIPVLDKPDFGDAVPMEPGELPVFWACGATPQGRHCGGAVSFRHHPHAWPDVG